MKEAVSLIEAMQAQEDWLADVEIYPAGEKQVIVRARSSNATCFLDAAYGELLAQCCEFKTLDEHLHTFYQRKQMSGTQMSAEVMQSLRASLQQLAQDGYLISHSQLRCLFEKTKEQTHPTRITSIGILTCNRAEAMQSSLSSYMENCQRFGRNPEFVVVDDSQSASTRKAYREMLRGLKKRSGMTVAYAGLEEKMRYARKLSEVGKIPEEIVFWACMGDQRYSGNGEYGASREGANRNSLLLHTVGECILSSDDDLICRVAASPGYQEGLTLRFQGNPCQYWYYPDRERALEATPPVEQDILALHEQWLGQDPRVAGAPYSRAGQISVEQAEPGFLHRFVTRPGKIVLTAHGVIGDGSWRTTDFLFFSPAESLRRQMHSEEAYLTARTSREIAQVADRLTLMANPSPLIGMCIGGLDNRELLPPFPPNGRAVDIAFGAMLSRCLPDAYTVSLPWVLLHEPPGARLYLEPILNEGGYICRDVPFYEWLQKCISRFYLEHTSTPTDHLHQLAEFLEHIGRLPTPAFEEFARQSLWQNDGGCIASLEQRLHRDRGLLASWKRDAEAYCARAQECMMLPIEQRLQGGAELAQRAIAQFAQILHWWPTIIETARRLRADGIRVAQPL